MTHENEIRQVFTQMQQPLATYNSFFAQWSANSQYGYPLKWFNTKNEAEQFTLLYYNQRMHLIRQLTTD